MADNMNVTVRDPLAPRRQMPPIVIGRAGEYGATTVTFDLRGLIDRYGAGVPTLLHKRPPDDEAYIVPPSAADTETHDRTEMPDSETLVWHVGQVATSYVGNGKIELQWHPNGAAKKSAQFDVVVLGTIGNPVSEIPDAQQIYLDVMQGIADDAEDAADKAEAAVSHYPKIREGYWWVWDVESGEWVNTGVKAQGEGGTTANAVLYTPQSLSDAQKTQARTNVGAGTYSKPSGGIPKTDLASDVQTSLGKADTALQQHQSLAGYATESYVQTQIAAIPDELPSVTASDNGKVLGVVNGEWAVKSDEGGSPVTVDSALSTTSTNPVQNKVVKAAINEIWSMFEVEPETQGSYNLLNPAEAVDGYYITNTNDTPQRNASYWYSGFIPVEVGKTYTFQRGNLTVASGRQIEAPRWTAAYDANKTLLSAKGGTYLNSYTVPDGVAFVRISTVIDHSPKDHYTTYVEGTTLLDYEAYEAPSEGAAVLKPEINNEPYLVELIGNQLNGKVEAVNNVPFGFSHSFSLANGATYSIEYSMQDKLDYCMAFRGDISADFQGVIMSHGYQIVYGGYVKVTPTHVEYYLGTESSPRLSVEHGLTLTDYVSIVLNANAVNKMNLTVYTNGGSFERTGLAWDVCRGYLRAQAVGTTTMQNCKLSYWCKDWAASTHLFGDSYFSMYQDRWTYYLRNAGFDNNLINGYGGRTAQDALPVAKTVLEHSQPKRVVWCLGMNNADSGAVNANWKTSVEELAAICDARNIELILATIPNVATVDNTYKNAYVRASGRRYIDFASAVGAENDTTWYDGMLSNDGTHPTAKGAVALYTQALADVPELMEKEDVPTKVSQLANDSGYQTAQDVQTAIAGIQTHDPRVAMASTDTTVTLNPNTLYVFPEMASLAITLATPTDSNIVNEYHFIFTSGATATTLSIPATVNQPDGFSVDANMVYEVSILENNMTAMSWEVTA